MYVNAARGKKKPKIEGLMVYKNMGILVICEATLKGRGEEFMNQLGMECLEDFDAAERVVRGMERGLLDHHVVLRKARIVGAWIKKREVVIGARRIKSEKLTKDRYREGYARSLERKGVECDEDNVEHNWDQMK